MPSPLLILAAGVTIIALCLLAWKGRRPERQAAVGLFLTQVLSGWVDHLLIGRFRWAVACISLGLLIMFVRLSLRHDRWWLILAAGAQFLALATHISSLVGSDALTWSIVTARMTVWVEIMLLAIFGVWEARAAPYAQPKLKVAREDAHQMNSKGYRT
jgi:presenilin-like A22 family membrane protease